jgi:hypothetical protein
MHISEFSKKRTARVEDLLQLNDQVTGLVCDVDIRGRGKFSIRALMKPGESAGKYIMRSGVPISDFMDEKLIIQEPFDAGSIQVVITSSTKASREAAENESEQAPPKIEEKPSVGRKSNASLSISLAGNDSADYQSKETQTSSIPSADDSVSLMSPLGLDSFDEALTGPILSNYAYFLPALESIQARRKAIKATEFAFTVVKLREQLLSSSRSLLGSPNGSSTTGNSNSSRNANSRSRSGNSSQQQRRGNHRSRERS